MNAFQALRLSSPSSRHALTARSRQPSHWCAILLAGTCGCVSLLADSIQLRPGQALQDGAAALLPGTTGGGYAIPCVTDWNGDGKKDLLVGFQSQGKIALYLNRGTDAKPAFTNYTVLKTGDGQDIVHVSGGCGAPACFVCDFDHDGRRDLLVGAGNDGSVWFYRNTNVDTAPILTSGVKVLAGGAALSVSARAAPCVADWDEDDLPDLLCGAADGYVYFFRNTNTLQAPLFAPGVRLQASGANLFLGIRSVVRVFDWDGDGLKDLVCSSDTGVYWCRNTNNNPAPILQAPRTLRAPVSTGLAPIVLGSRMRLDLADWNDDGVIDLVLGYAYGTVYLYEGYQFSLRQPVRQANGLVLQWNSAPFLKYHLLDCRLPSGGTNRLAESIPSGGTLTTWTNPIIGDQQFIRVQVAE